MLQASRRLAEMDAASKKALQERPHIHGGDKSMKKRYIDTQELDQTRLLKQLSKDNGFKLYVAEQNGE